MDNETILDLFTQDLNEVNPSLFPIIDYYDSNTDLESDSFLDSNSDDSFEEYVEFTEDNFLDFYSNTDIVNAINEQTNFIIGLYLLFGILFGSIFIHFFLERFSK